jgi:uncharacterized C2H2 Zn-finger protein
MREPPWYKANAVYQSELSEPKPIGEEFATKLSGFITDYVAHVEGAQIGFACPVCLKIFPFESASWRHLTKAHIWPDAIGGIEWTILCKRCNNALGSELDNLLVDLRRENIEFTSSDSPGPLKKVTAVSARESITVAANVKGTQETGLLLTIPKKGNYEPNVRKFFEIVSLPPSRRRIDLDFLNDERLGLAFLNCAFLLMFNRLGYEFAFSPLAEAIRISIWNYDNPVQVPDYSVPRLGELSEMELYRWESSRESGFLITIPELVPGQSDQRCIFLPEIWSRNFEFIEKPDGISLSKVNPDLQDLANPAFHNIIWRKLYGVDYCLRTQETNHG